MGISKLKISASVVSVILAAVTPAQAWWGNGHETITQGAMRDLAGTGDLQRFFSETSPYFTQIPHIEPAFAHFIDIDETSTTTGNAGSVSYGTDFTNFRAGTFTFPTTLAAANARYGSSYVSNNGGVPWTAAVTLDTLSAKMQAATTYSDWYHLLPTAGALAHYIEDMHQPMHLTANYNPGGLHGRYEGGEFETGSVSRYPELLASITPVVPTYYGTTASAGFVTAIFNRIPHDYDKNVAIQNADTVALTAGSNTSVAYMDSLWNQTKSITKDSFQDGAAFIGNALYTAYVNAGSPVIPQATFFATASKEQSTISPSGPVTDFTNDDFFKIRGGSTGNYGVARFDMATIKAQYDARYGPGNWVIDNVALATEVSTVNLGSIKVYYSSDDVTNIQTTSTLKYADNGSPLGINFATDTPLLQFTNSTSANYAIDRFDSHTSQAFNFLPLQGDILSGGLITLAFAPGATATDDTYYGGAGLSLEISAHAIPEPAFLGLICLVGVGLSRRRSRNQNF